MTNETKSVSKLKKSLIATGIIITLMSIIKIIQIIKIQLECGVSYDSGIYWGVGRGIFNGLKIYIDLFENKPPGIFIISYLSILLTRDVYLGIFMHTIAGIIICVVPIVFLLLNKKDILTNQWKIEVFLLTIIFGALMSQYTFELNQGFQVETIAAAFACVYALFVSMYNKCRSKINNKLYLVILSFLLLLSYGMKEPFILACLACSIIFSENIKMFVNTFILPLAISVFFGGIALLASGNLIPYFTKYLGFIFGFLIIKDDSTILQRALHIDILLKHLFNFSFSLLLMINFILIIYVLHGIIKIWNTSEKSLIILHFLKSLSILFLITLSIGISGDLFMHHFVCAVPIYIALYMYVLFHITRDLANVPIAYCNVVLLVFFFCFTINIESISHDANFSLNVDYFTERTAQSRKDAKYIDYLLDELNEERYFYIGSNDYDIYAYSLHSPQGPFFFQPLHLLRKENSGIRNDFINQLHNSKLIVMSDKLHLYDLRTQVLNYIKINYTTTPWKPITNAPPRTRVFKYYFKKDINKY